MRERQALNTAFFILGLVIAMAIGMQDARAADEFTGLSPTDSTALSGGSVADVIEQARVIHDAWCLSTWPAHANGARVESGPSYLGVSGGEHRWFYELTCQRISGSSPLSTVSDHVYADEDSCPDGADPTSGGECPATCAVLGLTFFKQGIGSAPASLCDQGCSFVADGANIAMGGGWMGNYTATGSCSPDDGGISTGLNCLQTSGGTQYCADTTATGNCGTINGEYVCLDSVPEGNCILTPFGQAICDEGSQTNTPDETIELDSDTGGVDVYESGNTGGTPTAGTDDTDGDGNPGGPGDDDGEGECEGESCFGELPGDNEEVGAFGDLFSGFYARVEGAPLVAAFDAIPGSMPTGACSGFDSDPIAALDGTVLTFDLHCTLWPDIVTVIYPVMLAAWSLLGGIIILRA